MTDAEINSVSLQIRDCVYEKGYVFHCCGQSFPYLLGLKKHLMEFHRDEYKTHFKAQVGVSERKLEAQKEIHRKAIQGEQKLYEKMKQVKGYDDGPSPAVGSGLHIIYTPMGNKR